MCIVKWLLVVLTAALYLQKNPNMQKKSCKKPLYPTCSAPTSRQTVREQLVNIVELLAAKETDISLRRCWRPKTELKEREYWPHIHQVTQTRLHVKDHVVTAGCGHKQLFLQSIINSQITQTDFFLPISHVQCYYIGATNDAATKMINEVSKPLSYHVPVEKICEKLKKKDSQICELKYGKEDLKTLP